MSAGRGVRLERKRGATKRDAPREEAPILSDGRPVLWVSKHVNRNVSMVEEYQKTARVSGLAIESDAELGGYFGKPAVVTVVGALVGSEFVVEALLLGRVFLGKLVDGVELGGELSVEYA